jgi:hypothetical protein
MKFGNFGFLRTLEFEPRRVAGVSFARNNVLGPLLSMAGAKLSRAMSGTAIDHRVVIKRDPPEHGFGLWPGSGKVVGKVLILDLSGDPSKIFILLDSVLVWLRARASNCPPEAPLPKFMGHGSRAK